MYLFTQDELEHMTPDELTAIIDAAFALLYGCLNNKQWNADTKRFELSGTESRVRDLFISAIAPLHESARIADKLNGSMLYRPMLDPFSHEDFDAAYAIRANLDAQLNRACAHLEYMRQGNKKHAFSCRALTARCY